jgi:hypothetical protein
LSGPKELDCHGKISLRKLRHGCAAQNFTAQSNALDSQDKNRLRSFRSGCAE